MAHTGAMSVRLEEQEYAVVVKCYSFVFVTKTGWLADTASYEPVYESISSGVVSMGPWAGALFTAGVLCRQHPTVACRQTMPRHVSKCYASARVLGVLGSGRQAIRYGPKPPPPRGAPPRCLPGIGSQPHHACIRLWPAAKPCPDMYLHVARPP